MGEGGGSGFVFTLFEYVFQLNNYGIFQCVLKDWVRLRSTLFPNADDPSMVLFNKPSKPNREFVKPGAHERKQLSKKSREVVSSAVSSRVRVYFGEEKNYQTC